MEFGANGPAGLSVPRLALIMLMMLDFDGDSVSATIKLARKTLRLPVVETVRSRSHATLCSAQVLQIHGNFYKNIPLVKRQHSKSCVFFPVNGGWSQWSPWSQCSLECDSGVKTRERFCNSPTPQHGGSSCTGPHIQTRDCNSHPCSGPRSSQLFRISLLSNVVFLY